MEFKSPLILFVNGKKIVDESPDAEENLLKYLRNKLRLCGAKEACGEGGCGACTVMISKYNHSTNETLNLAVNACLIPICSLHGWAVVTVEGLGSVKTGLHPIQERIAKSHGTQCGFCTPGFVMSMHALLRNNSNPSEKDIENAFQGNLCRCTGYRPILDGFKTFIQRDENQCCKKNNCCKKNGDLKNILFEKSAFKPYDSTQDPIFPSELKINHCEYEKSISFGNGTNIWFRIGSLEQFYEIIEKHQDGKIIAGNSEIGVQLRYNHQSYMKYIQISSIPELMKIEETKDHIKFGSCVIISEIQNYCNRELETIGSFNWAVSGILKTFAGAQIRNIATIGGNILSSRHVSDIVSLLIAAGAILIIGKRGMIKEMQLAEFIEKKMKLENSEILISIIVPKTLNGEFLWGSKVSRRREDDIAIVNCGMKIKINKLTAKIENAILVFGGLGPKALHAKQASQFLIGKKFSEDLTNQIAEMIIKDIEIPLLNKGMAKYKLILAPSLFYKFYLHVQMWLTHFNNGFNVNDTETSGMNDCTMNTKKGSQLFQIVSESQHVQDLVGRPIPNVSSLKAATGEAEFTDDILSFKDELFGYLVLSTRAHAKIISIDPAPALQVPNVVDFIDANSILAENNNYHCVIPDEQVFANPNVTCYGQTIGMIIAKDKSTAEKAAKLVKIEYEDLMPRILTIEEAIGHNSFFEKPVKYIVLKDGNVEESFNNCDQIIEGKFRIGGQEHFYMETQSAIVVPKEDGEMEVQVSTQSVTATQMNICHVLGLQQNKVIVKCRRAGGGFGGKENRCLLVAVPAAIAAQKHKLPVRCILNRRDDMEITGGREPFLIKYKVGFNKDGKIQGIKVRMYANGGNSLNLTLAIVEKSVVCIDGGYKIPNWDIKAFACKTNLPANVPFRGFGAPEGIISIEAIVDHVAQTLQMSPEKIREINMYTENDVTPYGEFLENCTMRRCWDECLENSNYYNRKEEIENFNKMNKWKKRGISINPTKLPVGLSPAPFFAQAGALVSVFVDGTVCLNHGGIEIGQGLNTKMIQIASRILKIGPERIYTGEMISHRVPNSSPTVASMSTDMIGPAVIIACEKIMKRLEPIIIANPNGSWENWIKTAYFSRTNLNATGFYMEEHSFNIATKEGKACSYVCYGVGATEVEIDVLTGDHVILRTDIVMDVGESLNPAIDIGQIEGAFVQGCGLVTLEEILFAPDGSMLTKGVENYKIPSVGNIPQEFNVSLLLGAPNKKAVYSSKAVGEPPLLLGVSLLYAIKNGIDSYRKERNLNTDYQLSAPATCEKIRLLCEDQFVQQMKMGETIEAKLVDYSITP